MQINKLSRLLDLFPKHQDVIKAALELNPRDFIEQSLTFGDDFLVTSQYFPHSYTTQAESHQVYTDIQFVLEGYEIINYLLDDQVETRHPYNEEKDVEIYSVRHNKPTSVYLYPGIFVSFPPGDIHQPQIRPNDLLIHNPNEIKKVVLKLKQ